MSTVFKTEFDSQEKKDNLRTTTKRQEILAVLMEAMIKQITITLWQVINGQRVIVEGMIIGVEDEVSIRLKPTSGDGPQNYSFDDKTTLYIHGFHRSILFKQEILSLSNNLLVLKIPREMRLIELRKNPRYYFPYEDQKEMLINKSDIDKKKQISLTLIDIAAGGAGVVISENLLKNFPVGCSFPITAITHQELPAGLTAEVMHVRPYKRGRLGAANLHALGLKFNKELAKIIYKPINKNSEMLEEKKKKLELIMEETRTDAYRLNNKNDLSTEDGRTFLGYTPEQIETILTKMQKTDPKLATALNENHQYLTRLKRIGPLNRQTLLRQIELQKLAAALRLCEIEVIDALLDKLSTSLKAEFVEMLQCKLPPLVVKKAQDELIAYLKEKELRGEFVLAKASRI